MAQAATMGPPMSLRETRRSGRRSAPSASTSTSKSPDSTAPDPPRTKEPAARRPSVSRSNNGSRNKRLKQEDLEDTVDDHKNAPVNGLGHGSGNGRAKPKGKEKEKEPLLAGQFGDTALPKAKGGSLHEDVPMDEPEEEETGITRCVCGSTGEDDPDAGEFMVQCETCQVWQHGPCMGFDSEDQLHDDDYHCELCRPELHLELLKRLSKKARHSSANSHHNSGVATSRLSRSHSPSYQLKPNKRRNTMNSRDAAFDESLKEIMEATAAEAAAAHDSHSVTSVGRINGHFEDETESSSRKKRKRGDDDSMSKKRTRSASTLSDRAVSTILARDEPRTNGGASGSASAPKSNGRNRRGGARKAQDLLSVDGEEGLVAASSKRQGQGGRSKISATAKRALVSQAVHAVGSNVLNEHNRRNQSQGANGIPQGSTSAEGSRAYRNSHAYVVSQQPLFTSWNLPDYLAHLEPMLPTDAPRPLEVRGTGIGAGGRESMERTMERGVKVKWPSKRMSVVDMNKRVRALVEWVGREQASAMDRGRRREALEKEFKATIQSMHQSGHLETAEDDADAPHDPDQNRMLVGPLTILRHASPSMDVEMNAALRSATMKMMEELMEELIGFQERFGPGAKTRDRERRTLAT